MQESAKKNPYVGATKFKFIDHPSVFSMTKMSISVMRSFRQGIDSAISPQIPCSSRTFFVSRPRSHTDHDVQHY